MKQGKEKETIFIEGYEEDSGHYSMSLESLLIIHVYQICKVKNIEMKIRKLEKPPDTSVTLDISGCDFSILMKSDIPKISEYCMWPIMIFHNSVIAGLSAVARQIIKSSDNEGVKYLLGFREGCLMACSEASIWTMFCEVDMPKSVKNMLKNLPNDNSDILEIPNSLSRFEYHMNQPVRTHNIYKAARLQNEKISMDTPRTELNIHHKFVEGPTQTLSDVILFPCVKVIFDLVQINGFSLCEDLPLVHEWYDNMKRNMNYKLNINFQGDKKYSRFIIDCDSTKLSLYKSDVSNKRLKNKMLTKQSNLEKVFDILNTSVLNIKNSYLLFGSEISFSWENIPTCLNPCGGSLPNKRAARKCQQLESIVKAVLKVADGTNHKIVDFCSGSGHLGLLLAYLLPKCDIVLVENKEKSLSRAKERILQLGLANVTVVQSNLDYFCGNFGIGVSLHACGTATDLVLRTCIDKKAHFVCCPCCYGGIKQCYLVGYPQSEIFSKVKDLTYRDYLSIAHGADQTHDSENAKTEQGYKCMDVIDTDRMLYAENFGYSVFLGKLQPVTCTNKNNLIVGIKK